MGSPTLFHPKNGKRCALCKRWNGDANLTFKNPQMGYQFMSGVLGKCMQTNSNQMSTNGVNCTHYAPSVDAEKLM